MSYRLTPPRPRPSAHTQVGLGAVEAGNGNDATPPSGIDLNALSKMGVEGGVLYLGGQIDRVADDLHREYSELRASQRRKHAENQETIARLEHVSSRAAAHAELAEQAADSTLDAVHALREELDSVKLALLGEVLPALRHVQPTLERVVELQRAVVALAEQLGQPPQKLDQRSSQIGELTAEELVELEQGTGLAGVVGRLVAGQARLAKRVGIGAAVAAASAPVAVEIIKAIFGG